MSVDVAVIESINGNVAIVDNAQPVAISTGGTNFAIAGGGGEITAIINRGEPGPPSGVVSAFGRIGNVTAQSTDYSAFYQSLDAYLTQLSGLTPTTGQSLIYGASAWEARALIAADVPNLPASKITSGTIDDVRISSNITRDTELTAAIAAITAASIGALTQSVADTRYTQISGARFKARALYGYEPFEDAPTKSGSKIIQKIWRSVRNGNASTKLLTIDYFYTGSKVSSMELTDHRRLTAGDSDARIRKHVEPTLEIWYEEI